MTAEPLTEEEVIDFEHITSADDEGSVYRRLLATIRARDEAHIQAFAKASEGADAVRREMETAILARDEEIARLRADLARVTDEQIPF